jgi:methylmalonyl-CoA epimerase
MQLDHIGVAVEDLDASLVAYEALGLPSSHREMVPGDHVEVAFVPFAGGRFELLQPQSDKTVVGRFLAKRGPGLHHVALAVDNLRTELQRLQDAGVRLIDVEPRPGAEGTWVAFVHPASTGGVLLELVERPVETRERG